MCVCVCWKSLRCVAKDLLSEVQSFAVSETHNLVVCKSVLMTSLSQLGVVPSYIPVDMLHPIEGNPFCEGEVYYNQ